MAAYFHGNPPEISNGSDGGLQTLVVVNPTSYVQYSDHHQNPQATTNNHLVLLDSHAPPPPPTTQHQQFLGIPLSGHEPAADNTSALHGFIRRVHQNLYPHMDPTQQPACETPRAQQGLSLTLSSQRQQTLGFGSGDEIRLPSASTRSGVTNGLSALLSSRYLKAARELLDDLVYVNNDKNNGIENNTSGKLSKEGNNSNKATAESSIGARDGWISGEAAGRKRAAELTTAERQEIQMKKAKLISMLDEVDQRYRQYHQQMQIVVSSFEQVAGTGSAKTYTSLALKTISKHFRSLKDVITDQIRAANKCLGEEDSPSCGKTDGPGLKFDDQRLKRQRTLGIIQHHANAWRPQRGLPERAVSVLRAWLFEHFLHPYPKDSDKHMLAKQTGLTRSQVSNWFINARVRLWKPMVEEMYIEEMKEQEKNGSLDNTEPNIEDSSSKSMSNQDKIPVMENHQLNNHNTPSISMSTDSNPPVGDAVRSVSGFTLNGSSELDGVTTERSSKGYSFMGNHNNLMGNFEQYPIEEIPRFQEQEEEQFTPRFSGNNGVSLSLGLPHQNFLPCQSIRLGRGVEIGEPDLFSGKNTSSTHHSSSSSLAYDSINIQNRKAFAAQLLPDFVA